MPKTSVPDVRKSVTVPIPAEQAFKLFAEDPIGWWPERFCDLYRISEPLLSDSLISTLGTEHRGELTSPVVAGTG